MQINTHQYAGYAKYLILMDSHAPRQRRRELQQPDGLRQHALPAGGLAQIEREGGGEEEERGT
jgi:hypothetical protein